MKILVTGGAGFIGSNVVDRYIELGHDVSIVDDLSTGKERNLNPAATFYKIDITNHQAIQKLLEQERFDVINHHAAQMDVRKSVQDPIFDATVNILGSINLIKCASETGVNKMIYISTGGAVYGEPASLPVMENDEIRPECQYGISKHTVEHYLYLYRKMYNLDYTVLRYPNVFGPRQNPHGDAGVIAIFAGMMLQDKTPTIYGDGAPERDYVFIQDVVNGNVAALTKGSGEIVNLGSEKGTSVLELYDIVKKYTNYDGTAVYAPLRPGEIDRIYLTGKKAFEVLGWTPQVSLEEGLEQTVEWVKNSNV